MNSFKSTSLFCTILLIAASPVVSFAATISQDQPTPANSPYSNEETFEQRYNAIADLRNQGDPVAAMELMSSLLIELESSRASDPENSAGKSRLFVTLALEANLLRDLNRNDESIAKQRTLLDLTANDTELANRLLHLEVRQNYALSLGQKGQREQAIEEIRQAVGEYAKLQTLHPGDSRIVLQSTTASNNLGTQLVLAGNPREAIDIFETAISLLRKFPEDGDSRDRKLSLLLLNNAMATASVGNPIKARQQIEEAIQWKEKLGEDDSQDAIRARITLGAILGRLNRNSLVHLRWC